MQHDPEPDVLHGTPRRIEAIATPAESAICLAKQTTLEIV
jgi:hypothetical protein